MACSDSSDPVIEPPPEPVEIVINGKALKGVITNPVITVYKFDSEGNAVELTDDELNNAEIIVDEPEPGNYSFTVVDYNGPIKVEISPSTDPDNPTTMTCDAPIGCGDTDFGAEIDLTTAVPDFTLAAISVVDDSSGGEVVVNVSALTHLAAALIEADEDGVNAASVTEQSAIIASTFGIVGDITTLEPTATTDASAVVDAEADELRYGLINAGIMAALFSGETDEGILSTKLAQVAEDLVANNGAFLVTQDDDEGFELALADVLSGAGEVAAAAAEAIAADDSLDSEAILASLAQEEVNLANEQAYQEANVGDDGLAEVVVDVPTEGDAVAKAMAMVEDVRLFTHLFDETTTEGAGIKSQGDEYIALMDEAGLMIEAEAASFTLMAQLSEALAELSLQYDAGTLTPEMSAGGVAIADYLTEDEITGIKGDATGTITFNENTTGGGLLFIIDAVAGNETVKLNASAEFSEDMMSIKLTFDGSIESAGAKFTLSDGSFAQVNLDTAASRAAFDNDTYEGEIISGELMLEVILEQKISDMVTNPITFIGMLHTKLLPVDENILDERWEWNDSTEQDNLAYGRPEIETLILPEMLTLSGQFSSLEGDLISAALTVNINNLDGYEAPEFKYIGKEISDVMAINISEDKNIIVVTPSSVIVDPFTLTRTYTPGSASGEWTNVSSNIPENTETHPWGESLIETEMVHNFDVGLDESGMMYSFAALVEGNGNHWAWVTKITPVDYNDDGIADGIEVTNINIWDGQEYDAENLLDSNGNLLLADGSVHSFEGAWNLGTFSNFNDFLQNSGQSWVMPYDLNMITNATDLYAQKIANDWGSEIGFEATEGKASVFFDDESLMALKAGTATSWNAFITQARLEDAVTFVVSADKNTVTGSLGHSSTLRTFAFTGEGESFGNFEALTINTEDDYSYEIIEWSTTMDVGLDIDTVVISKSVDEWEWHYQVKIMPVDSNDDGLTDSFNAYYLQGAGFNDNGDLLNDVNEVMVFDETSWLMFSFTSYDDENWNPDFGWAISYNPMMVASALDIYKGYIVNAWEYSITGYADDIGKLEAMFSEDDIDSIVASSTTMFDAYNTEADSKSLLEDADTFLDVNAALTLEAILGEYQVKLQLSGERTGLEDGVFDLEMSYRLPGEDSQRSFTVHANTEEEGRFTANNFEGVVLVLNEPDEDATGTQVIGQILVGPTAIVAATIEDRSGAIFIVYTDDDGTVESL